MLNNYNQEKPRNKNHNMMS